MEAIKKSISLRINPAIYEQIKELSIQENRSINNFLETLILNSLSFKEKDTIPIKSYSKKTGKRIREAIEAEAKGELIKLTPEMIWALEN